MEFCGSAKAVAVDVQEAHDIYIKVYTRTWYARVNRSEKYAHKMGADIHNGCRTT